MQGISDRRDFIARLLRERGHLSVAELSAQTGVSEVTVRKDLRALEDEGLLSRTHGGAHVRPPLVPGPAFQGKAAEHADEKKRIGEAAAALVEEGDSIIVGSGTTMTHLARNLSVGSSLSVVTSGLNVALEIARAGSAEVLLLGGMLRVASTSVVGPHAEAMLEDTACDTLFLGADGFDVEYGLTTSDALEAALDAAMIRAAQTVVVLADSSKFGRRGFRRICPVEAVDRVITDRGVGEEAVDRLREKGVQVDVV